MRLESREVDREKRSLTIDSFTMSRSFRVLSRIP